MIEFSSIFWLDLQRFAEGETAAPADTGGGDSGTTGAIPQTDAGPATPRAKSADPYANVIFGNPPPGSEISAVQDASAQDAAPQVNEQAEWEAAREKYKQFYDAEMQGAIRNRIKNIKASEDTLTKLNPVIQQMYQQYNIQQGDIDGLINAVQNDDSLLANEAMERGVTVEQLREIKRLEAANTELQQLKREEQNREFFGRHVSRLQQQAEQLKQTFPNFDLRKELSGNAEFRRLTSPEVGVDVETAYYVTHRREIAPKAMQVGFQKAQESFMASQQANAARPSENGTKQQPAVDIRSDPSKWTKKEREEVRRRVSRGDKVYL